MKVSDSGIYVCQVSDGVHIGYKNVTLTVGGKKEIEIFWKYLLYLKYHIPYAAFPQSLLDIPSKIEMNNNLNNNISELIN